MLHKEPELKRMIEEMRTLSGGFYRAAQQIGNHAFIEFNGFMNEYIKLCQQSLDSGLDFTEANEHVGKPLVVHGFNAAYIGEKFGCVFETSFSNLAMVGAFCANAFKLKAKVEKRGGQEVLVLSAPKRARKS